MIETPRTLVIAPRRPSGPWRLRAKWVSYCADAESAASRLEADPRVSDVFALLHPQAPRESADCLAYARGLDDFRGAFLPWAESPAHLVHYLAEARLRSVRSLLALDEPCAMRRVVNAWHIGAAGSLVADAELVDDTLCVTGCDLVVHHVSVADVPALARLRPSALADLEIADDGAWLHWPAAGVHLGLDDLRTCADPDLREAAAAERVRNDERLGEAVCDVRLRAGLGQAAFPGLSDRQVRRIERGGRPRVATLRKLAEGHGLSLEAYLDLLADALAG